MPYIQFTKIENEKFVFSLHIKQSTSSVTRVKINIFYYLLIFFVLQRQCFCNYFYMKNNSKQINYIFVREMFISTRLEHEHMC